MQQMASKGIGQHAEEMARALDGPGKRYRRENEGEFRRGMRQSGYVAAAIINLVLLYVANNLLAWDVPFLTDSFIAALAVFNVSLLAQVVANLAFLVYDPSWFRHLLRTGLNVISFAVVYTLLIIFPFDFGLEAWNSIARIVLIVALVGIAIGTIVEFFQLIFGLDRD